MGLGLRTEHYDYIFNHKPKIDWFEILTENYLYEGGNPMYYLDKIREDYPLVMHGVSLSIGSTDPLNYDYLNQVLKLAQRVEPQWISDHLCWTGVHQQNIHDLLPIAYTEKNIAHICERIARVQDFYQRQLVLENVSSYISYKDSEMSEWEFLTELAKRADCLILLDLNNIYVSGFNHGFDPEIYLNSIPVGRVQQFHLAGHLNCEEYIIDTHDHPVIDEVWELFQKAVYRFGDIATMIERDADIPPFETLQKELNHAQRIKDRALAMKGEALYETL